MITAAELADFVEGETTVDVQQLKEVVQYSPPYHPNHPVVRLFWQLVDLHMFDDQRKQLLLFWSGSRTTSVTGFRSDPVDRDEDLRWLLAALLCAFAHIGDWFPFHNVTSVPLLKQALRIRPRYHDNRNQKVLPEACTCSRELSLPAYHSLATMREKILAALEFASMGRSEEHTSELQSLMRISYAVFCLKKKKH